jgi:hypothetical protein
MRGRIHSGRMGPASGDPSHSRGRGPVGEACLPRAGEELHVYFRHDPEAPARAARILED